MKVMIFIFLIVLTGCVTQHQNTEVVGNDIARFDQIKLGDVSEAVKGKLGLAYSESNGSSDEFSWYYKSKENEKSVKAMITFDKQFKNVQDIVLFPTENENEINLDYLLHTKFKNLEFENLKNTTCKNSFYANTEFYLNKKDNLIIKYKMRRKFVEYYSYQSNDRIKGLIQAFNKCVMKDY